MHHGTHTIREIMTPDPRTIEATTSIVDAAKLMRDEDVGPLPVVEGERVVGLLTDRDIVIRTVAEGKDPHSVTAGEIASKQLVTIDPEQSLDEAARLMAEHQVRRLPVCEEDGRLVGIVAQADLALQGHDATTGEVVQQISK